MFGTTLPPKTGFNAWLSVEDLTHPPEVSEFAVISTFSMFELCTFASGSGFTMTPAGRSKSSKSDHLQRTIYLDANATTYTHPLALQAAREAMELCFGNPSSTHITGLHARSFLESAREAAKLAVGASTADEIIFNSGATEGIQTAIFSVLTQLAQKYREGGTLNRFRILFGATEHKAVPAALYHWAAILNVPVVIEPIPVNSNGVLDQRFIAERVSETALLCTMAVNNETGVIQPLPPLVETLHSEAGRDCYWFVDGVQALGKVSLNLEKLGAHYACFSGHKLNAPKGIGFLYVRNGAPYTPLIVGGGQERGMRSGTENLPGAAAFGRILCALNDPQSGVFLSHASQLEAQQKLIAALNDCFPTLQWNVELKHCVATTLNFSVEGVSSKELMNAFDAVGVRVSGGSACSSGKTSGSHVLEAMHLHKWRAQNAIRMSFGPADSLQDINKACTAIRAAGSALQAHCMIPQRPARADQAMQFLQNLSSGISELRSSQGNRAWLLRTPANKNFLVADCALALNELNTKLACRGLNDTQVLLLDEDGSRERHRSAWHELTTSSGPALLFKDTLNNPHSQIVFAPNSECMTELNAQLTSIGIAERTKILACFVNTDSPVDSYDVFEWSGDSLVGSHGQGQLVTMAQTQIECTSAELASQLSEKNFLVLDVREPFESATSHLDEILIDLLGRRTTKKLADTRLSHLSFEIVPLSRLPQFIIDCMNNANSHDILCVCRSGQRSLQAAQLLRRTASCNAVSLQGGLAALLAPPNSLSDSQKLEAQQDK